MRWSSVRLRLPRCLLGHSVYISWVLRLVILTGSFIAGYHFIHYQFRPTLPPEYRHLQSLRSLTVPPECRIPRLDPWDPIILPYYTKPSPLVCRPVQKQMASLEDGILRFNQSLFDGEDCYLTPFWHNEGVSDFEIVYGDRILVNFTQTGYEFSLDYEFVEVRCSRPGVLTTRDVFTKNFAQIISRNSTRPLEGVKPGPIEPSSAERPSVVMLGIDGMSRPNFIRQLPKSHAQMKRMGFVDMLGQVKIHDNTYGNLVAVLRGIRSVSTKEFPAEMDENWEIYFDEYEMVWKNFTRNGYTTMFAEDRPDIATFNYMRQLCGFKQMPVDHYMRPYWLATYWSIVSRRSKSYCYDELPMHRVHLDFLEKFIKTYDQRRHFSLWWTQDASHDYLNVIGIMDDDLDGFLKRIEKKMENTVTIIFSDHGNRYDKIRETINGRLEARLPFLSIRLPPNIKDQFPFLERQLTENVNRMTTPFDLHETLNDLAWGTFSDPKRPSSLLFDDEGKPRKQRGYSLFGPIPKNRTCYDAGNYAQIPEDYCPCFNEKEIGEGEAKKAAEVLLARVNDILANAPELERSEFSNNRDFICAPIEIEKIQYASIRLPPQKMVIDPQTGDQVAIAGVQVQYRVVFQAKAPSKAIIEGIAVRDFNTNDWFTTNEFERNNAYGNTSSCVNEPVLKKLCYCLVPPAEPSSSQ